MESARSRDHGADAKQDQPGQRAIRRTLTAPIWVTRPEAVTVVHGRSQTRDGMEPSSALTILAAVLPTAGTIVIGVLSGLLNRSVRMVDEKLASIDRKLDGQGERLTRVEVRVEALERELGQLRAKSRPASR
jgi:hypothetical protein